MSNTSECRFTACVVIIACLFWLIPVTNYYASSTEFDCLLIEITEEQFEGNWRISGEALNLDNSNQTVTIRELCADANSCEEIKNEFYPEGEVIICARRPTSFLTPNKGGTTRAELPVFWSDVVGIVIVSIVMLLCGLLLAALYFIDE